MEAAVSYLFVPGNRPDRFAKALASPANRVILDLEDAVRPDAKATARAAILAAPRDPRLVVRINDVASVFFADDLVCLAKAQPAAVLIPKAETADTLAAVSAVLEAELLPQIETVRGLEAVPELLAHPSVRRAVFGHLDFALDIGAAPDWDALLYARSRLVALSRLAGAAAPVDSVTTNTSDAEVVEREARAARSLGFGGKLLIHPAQIAPVVRAFAPTATEIDWARRVMAAVGAGAAGALTIDGKMIDKPVELAAQSILARCQAGLSATENSDPYVSGKAHGDNPSS